MVGLFENHNNMQCFSVKEKYSPGVVLSHDMGLLADRMAGLGQGWFESTKRIVCLTAVDAIATQVQK
jgi:hypothetical protein